MVHMHNEILLSHKNKRVWMELEIIILSEISPAQKNKYKMNLFTCGIS
jgi:hypothetical protein